jgi:hypothetical protein
MSKEAKESQQQPKHIEQLMKNGTTVLEAPTREALVELVDAIPADCKYAVGAVGRNYERGTFTLRVDKI